MKPLGLHLVPAEDSAARDLRRRTARGELVRVAHGAVVEAVAFAAADDRARHRARVAGVLASARVDLVASHASAVALHGLPWFGDYPERPTFLDPTRAHGQRLRFSDKIAAQGRTLSTVVLDGIVTTDLVSTAVDVALRFDRGHAVAVLDHVLSLGIDREALLAELAGRSTVRGASRARTMIEFADGASESVGESIGRLVMRALRLPSPVLQQEFRLDNGRSARVDFWFPDTGVVVEFDGLVKYRDRSLRSGRTAEDVVIAEKLREDLLRAVSDVTGIARLTWRDVMPGGAAPSMLRRAGLPVPRGFDRTPQWR